MIYLIKWWFSIATLNYQRVYPQIGKMIMRNWNCGCSMFDKLLVRNSPYSPYSNFFHIPCQTGLKTRNRGMRTLRGMRYYAMTALKSLLTRAENVKSVVSPDCLWYMMMHRYALPPGSISMVDETIVICVGLVEYVPAQVFDDFCMGIPLWRPRRNSHDKVQCGMLLCFFLVLFHCCFIWFLGGEAKKNSGPRWQPRSSALGGSSSADRKWWLSLVPDSWALIHA